VSNFLAAWRYPVPAKRAQDYFPATAFRIGLIVLNRSLMVSLGGHR
jgi:hypothetical protein